MTSNAPLPKHDPSVLPPPLEGEEDLFNVFHGAFRASSRYVGIEAEKFGIYADGRPLHYADDDHHPGVQTIFRELVARYGWVAEAEKPGGPPLALVRDGASITLEPGSQFELSGAPLEDVHRVMAEVDTHRRELASLTSAPGLHFVGLGFHPLARQDDLDWVPKSRYPIMREYLPTRGKYGLDMMRRTATVQANFDFTSERDAMRKLRVALAAQPLVTALFACSPLIEGVRRPIKSYRAQVWLDMDNDRAGLLPFAWKPDATLRDYVEWALDVPMFILKRDGQVIRTTGHTFRRFMKEGIEGHRATAADWESHLKTLFPEARLQKTLEVRGADSVPARYSAALPALWLAVLYDDECLTAFESRLVPFGHDAWQAARPNIVEEGLAARIGDTTVGALARELLPLVDKALARRARTNDQGQDERVYLAPLHECAADDRSIGDLVLGGWVPSQPDALASLLERAAY
jgi:glutamate--cysteine ligase